MLNSTSRYSVVFILLLVWQSHAQPDRQISYPPFYAFLADNPVQETWPRPEFDDRDWQRLPFGNFPFENWRGQGWFRYGLEVDSARHEAPLGFSLTSCSAKSEPKPVPSRRRKISARSDRASEPGRRDVGERPDATG